MNHQLTSEFADTTQLSLNPLARHTQVRNMLNDASTIGESIHVSIDRMVVIDERPDTPNVEIPIYRSTERSFLLRGFLGRKALKNVANIINWVDSGFYEPVGGNCT